MESKPALLPSLSPEHLLPVPPPRRRRAGRWVPLAVLVALLVGPFHILHRTNNHDQRSMRCTHAPGNPDAVWAHIIPSANLTWTECYGDKQCAKFATPLDYGDLNGPQAAIALLKVPSKFVPGEEEYKGPILFNPGGPGGSGVDFMRLLGDGLRGLLGDGYDLVGFDPRGVGFTTPHVRIFADATEEAAWALRNEHAPLLNETPSALGRLHAQWDVYGALAADRVRETAEYVSTAFVARDMLAITRAHGFEKIKYWGFSYGSVLGMTYAAMFPDNIERLIVDGVLDVENYYQTLWSNNLRDTDAALDMIYAGCAEAGPEGCALHEPSAEAVKARVERIFAALKRSPLSVPPAPGAIGSSTAYGTVDYALVRSSVFAFLYAPYYGGSIFADILRAVEAGDGRPLWDLVRVGLLDYRCECGEKTPRRAGGSFVGRDALPAVACSDGDPVEDSLDKLQEHYEGMAHDSTFAELWSIRMMCSGWKIRPKERFSGPFVGNTSHPLLFIGNSADPVTPLQHARKMAKGFKDAVVLHQKSTGHSSLAAVSLCTLKAVRAYFHNGTLPAHGAECEIESRIFGAPAVDERGLSANDAQLYAVAQELSASFKVPMIHV